MKSLIALLAVAALAVADPWQGAAWNNWAGHGQRWWGPVALPPGYDAHGAPLPVQDTPEVAAAKAAHLSALARSGGSVPAGHGAWAGAHGGWAAAHGAWAAAPGNNNPLWNVAALPAGHAAVHNNPLWNVGALPAPAHGWAGHGAAGPVDTPEVAAAKAAHLAAHAAAAHGHRWRRSAVIAAPLALGHFPAATAPLTHVVAAPVAYHTTALSPALYAGHWW